MVPRRLASQSDWLHHADAVVLVAPLELHLHGTLLVLLVLGVNQARMHQAVVRALMRLLGFRLRIIRAQFFISMRTSRGKHDIGAGVARLNRDVQGRVVAGTASGTAHDLPIVMEGRSSTSAVSLPIIDTLDVISTGE